ncbi:ATP-binding cassette domain-containing protein [Magnetococcales bacterium HHB-1]
MKNIFYRLWRQPLLTFELLFISLWINILGLGSSIYVIQVLNRYVSYGIDSTLITLTVGVLMALAVEFVLRILRLHLVHRLDTHADHLFTDRIALILLMAHETTLNRLSPGTRRGWLHHIDTIKQAYHGTTLIPLLDLPFAFLFLFALFLISPLLSGVISIYIVLFVLVSIIYQRFFLNRNSNAHSDALRLKQIANDGLVHHTDTVRLFVGLESVFQRWQQVTNRADQHQRERSHRQGVSQTLTYSATVLLSIITIGVGAKLAVEGHMDVGLMIGANILAGRALALISRFIQLKPLFTRAKQAMKQLEPIYTLPLELHHGSDFSSVKGAVEMRDLAFAYPDQNTPLFESLSLTLKTGEVLMVHGANGSGKSTLVRLLSGLLIPTRGQILVDGMDLQQAHITSWRRNLVLVPQEPTFLEGSLHQNITLLNPEIPKEKLAMVLRMANLNQFIGEQRLGLEQPVWQGGVHLPLGIRKRLALARALVTEGSVVILDEPMAGLDKAGREAFIHVISYLVHHQRTLIIFADHSLPLNRKHQLLDLNIKPKPKVSHVAS